MLIPHHMEAIAIVVLQLPPFAVYHMGSSRILAKSSVDPPNVLECLCVSPVPREFGALITCQERHRIHIISGGKPRYPATISALV